MKTIQNYLTDTQLKMQAVDRTINKMLLEQKANGKKFISDEEIDAIIKEAIETPFTKAEDLNLSLQDTFEAYEVSNIIRPMGLFTLTNIQPKEIHFERENGNYPHRQFIENVFIIDQNKYFLSLHNIILIRKC